MNDDFYKEKEDAGCRTDEASDDDSPDALEELRERFAALGAACEEVAQACETYADSCEWWDAVEVRETEKRLVYPPLKKKDAPRKIGDVRHAAGAGRPLCRARNREQRTARVA